MHMCIESHHLKSGSRYPPAASTLSLKLPSNLNSSSASTSARTRPWMVSGSTSAAAEFRRRFLSGWYASWGRTKGGQGITSMREVRGGRQKGRPAWPPPLPSLHPPDLRLSQRRSDRRVARTPWRDGGADGRQHRQRIRKASRTPSTRLRPATRHDRERGRGVVTSQQVSKPGILFLVASPFSQVAHGPLLWPAQRGGQLERAVALPAPRGRSTRVAATPHAVLPPAPQSLPARDARGPGQGGAPQGQRPGGGRSGSGGRGGMAGSRGPAAAALRGAAVRSTTAAGVVARPRARVATARGRRVAPRRGAVRRRHLRLIATRQRRVAPVPTAA